MLLNLSIIFLICGISSAFASNMPVFIVLNSCIAAVTNGLYFNGLAYCKEHVGGKWSTVIGFAMDFAWVLGYLLVPLITLIVKRWDHLQLAISIPTLLFVVMLASPTLVPESRKWLLATGKRNSEACRKVQ